MVLRKAFADAQVNPALNPLLAAVSTFQLSSRSYASTIRFNRTMF
jgi:hypothetical protein